MTNVTPDLDSILQTHHNVHLRRSPRQRSDATDEFLKEAYRIVLTPLSPFPIRLS